MPDSLKILSGVTIIAAETAEEADQIARELDDLVPPAVGIDYLSKMVGVKMAAYPLDEPFPDLNFEHVGPTGIGKAIVAKALEGKMTVRETSLRGALARTNTIYRTRLEQTH